MKSWRTPSVLTRYSSTRPGRSHRAASLPARTRPVAGSACKGRAPGAPSAVAAEVAAGEPGPPIPNTTAAEGAAALPRPTARTRRRCGLPASSSAVEVSQRPSGVASASRSCISARRCAPVAVGVMELAACAPCLSASAPSWEKEMAAGAAGESAAGVKAATCAQGAGRQARTSAAAGRRRRCVFMGMRAGWVLC